MPLTPDQMNAFGAMGWLPPGMTAATSPKLQPTDAGLPAPQANPDMQGPGAAGAAAHDAAATAGLSPEAAAGQAAGQSAYDQAAKSGPAAGAGGMSKQEAMAMIQGFQGILKAAAPKPVNVPPPITAPQPQTMQVAPITAGGPNSSWQ